MVRRFGCLHGAAGAGSLAGVAAAGQKALRPAWPLGTIMIFSDLAMGGVFLGFGVSGPIAVAAVLLGLIGFLSGYVQVRLAAWIQTNVPREMVGRVTSIYILILLNFFYSVRSLVYVTVPLGVYYILHYRLMFQQRKV